MSNRRLARYVIVPVLLLAVLPGCQAMHSYRPTPVQVIDADTQKPIAAAEVRISYPMSNSLIAPWESREAAGSDGIARTRAAPYGNAGAMVEITAKGYMNEQKFLTAQQVEAFERAGWFEDTRQRQAALVVGLYVEPRPTIELIVPPGYRGMVKARVRVQENVPMQPGQRVFRYDVPPSGEIVVTGPALFKHVVSTDIHFKYADNVPISAQGHDGRAGYWWIKNEENYNYFLVGTPRDNDDLRRSTLNRRMSDTDGIGVRQTEGWGHRRHNPSQPPADGVLPAGLFERSSSD